MGDMCTDQFRKPNQLVFEAVKLRALYLRKKRYAALQIEKYVAGETMAQAIARAEVVVKGLEGKRRDNAAIGSDTQNEIIDLLLKDANVEAAEEHVRNVITELLENRVDMSKLIITKGLSKTDDAYAKSGGTAIHYKLQQRMKRRAHVTGETAAQTGDRVPYIMLTGVAKRTGKGADKTSDLAEDPLHALRVGAPISKAFYIDKQIWPAVARIMTCIYEPTKCATITSDMKQQERERLTVYKRLFSRKLPHMRHLVDVKSNGYGITAFTQKMPKCVGCGVRIKDGVVCARCNVDDVRAKKRAELERAQAARDETRATCIKCQRGNEKYIASCMATSCANFFIKDTTVAVVKDIEDLIDKLK